MALDPSNSSNLEQLALNGLILLLHVSVCESLWLMNEMTPEV